MPDFDKLHRMSKYLAELTDPKYRQPGLVTWGMMVSEIWRDIAEAWYGDRAPARIYENASDRIKLETSAREIEQKDAGASPDLKTGDHG